jgi:hypothetical protein
VQLHEENFSSSGKETGSRQYYCFVGDIERETVTKTQIKFNNVYFKIEAILALSWLFEAFLTSIKARNKRGCNAHTYGLSRFNPGLLY